ncbi:MAG: (2Fe-2S)-binding protein [Spirochaetia bacterium]|nr:(2Fe-2S)-binding protein [Spirochaetia bacterium]
MENETFEIRRPVKICLCKGVTREQIIESIRRGNHSLEAIAKDTTASTGCGTCKRQVQKILEEELLLKK